VNEAVVDKKRRIVLPRDTGLAPGTRLTVEFLKEGHRVRLLLTPVKIVPVAEDQ
jgi:hypothetical protein